MITNDLNISRGEELVCEVEPLAAGTALADEKKRKDIDDIQVCLQREIDEQLRSVKRPRTD